MLALRALISRRALVVGGVLARDDDTPHSWSGSSSAIADAEWEDDVVTITFRGGGSYAYSCSELTWDQFLMASSKGRFVNEHFVGR